jgi:regulator of protease activity HflC (stomatin/prohibitin superfamily)
VEIVQGVFCAIVDWVEAHPMEAVLLALFAVRQFGTTVQSGWVGVLFRFGRARQVIGPGFRLLIPGFEHVRKIHSKAITQELAPQRIVTVDGLVYDVAAVVVYRVLDPMSAMIQVDDTNSGCATLGAIAVWEVMRDCTHEGLRDRERLDTELTSNVRRRIGGWGLSLERAGLTTIAPTGKTVQLTQIEPFVRERSEIAWDLESGGLTKTEALLLLGSHRKLASHAHARYLKAPRRHRSGGIILRRLAERISEEEAAAVDEEIDAFFSDDYIDRGVAEKALAKRGGVILPRLRERLRRVGDPMTKAWAERLADRIQKGSTEP